jgi:hypothetical protein
MFDKVHYHTSGAAALHQPTGEPWKAMLISAVLAGDILRDLACPAMPRSSGGAAFIASGAIVAARGSFREGLAAAVQPRIPEHPGALAQ